ncbi:MAG: ATP-dependent RecD-like DNA helicase, partial [Proteobacteria bacterium]|nr:ATP-dependent RecD-like DNA helicase [Pseudomonadota bacterium]
MTANSSHFLTILEGHLERITYYNAQTHYTIATLKASKTNNFVTVVGNVVGVCAGQSLKLAGVWETHPKYGQQFKIESYEVTLPASADGIRKYLESGIIKGIGPSTAERMVRCFGAKTLDIIEKNPEKLLEVEGIGKAKAALIINAWSDHHAVRRLMLFLQKTGVNTSYCSRIFQKFGVDALQIIQNDPYRLANDIPGIGFYFADTIARKMGTPPNDPTRIRACIMHLMQQSINQGHNFVYEDQLLHRCEELFQLEPHVTRDTMESLADSGELVVEDISGESAGRAVYLKELHLAETVLAGRLQALISVPVHPPGMDTERISSEVQKKVAIKLSPEQLHVLKEILLHRVAVITGGPGTGKTTLIRSINAVFAALGRQVLLAAPTGRAARRLSEVTRRKAETIHRLLGYNFKENRFDKNRDNPLDADAVIIDEASMVDTLLMFYLIQAVPMTAVLILVGDIFQLPSVGPGNVLSDLIASQRMPVFYLKKIFRQAQESPIVVNAHRVRRGEMPLLRKLDQTEEPAEFFFIEQNNPEKVAAEIVVLCNETIPGRFGFDPVHEVQVLTPMHKGVIGTTHLNQILQRVLNPNPVVLESRGSLFKPGDKVMHLKNNYQKEIFNGDIGTIISIDKNKTMLAID